jgi:predicted MFS family arabinose efflux permease
MRGAALASRVANEMTPVAVVLLMLDRGEPAALAGLVAGLIALPGIATGPLLGAWLDRSPRRRHLIALEQGLGAAGFAAIALLAGHVPEAAILALALATGALQPLSTGGMTSLLTHAGSTETSRASSLEAANFFGAGFLGPLLAAILAGTAGAAVAVFSQAALKLLALVLSAGVTRDGRCERVGAREPLAATLAAGLRQFAAGGPLAATTTVGVLSMTARGTLTVAFPFFAVQVLGTSEDFAGYMWAAFAAGGAGGALAFAPLAARPPAHLVALGGAALAGLAMLAIPTLDSAAAALATLTVAGLFYGPSLAASLDVRRRFTAEPYLGQVFTTAASAKNAGFALGAALSGALVAAIGPSETILVAGAAHLLAAAMGTLAMRGRR